MIRETAAKDVRIQSTSHDDWPALLDRAAQDQENHRALAALRAPRQLDPMSENTARKYISLIAPRTVQGYDQNVARFQASEEIYNHLAYAAATRLALGYETSKRLEGREPGELPPRRFVSDIYAMDKSSTFLGNALEESTRLHITAEGAKALKAHGRGAGRTKSKTAPPIQRRSLQYDVLIDVVQICAWVSIFKDDSFRADLLDLHQVSAIDFSEEEGPQGLFCFCRSTMTECFFCSKLDRLLNRWMSRAESSWMSSSRS